MDRAVERMVAESHGARPPWTAVVVIGAVAAVVAGVIALLAGIDVGGDAASAPTTSVRPGATPATRGAIAPAVSAPSTESVTFVGDHQAPVLGEQTGGLSLYAAGDGVIRRIELDTGRVTTLPARGEFEEGWRTIDVRPDQVRLVTGRHIFSTPRDLATGIQMVGDAWRGEGMFVIDDGSQWVPDVDGSLYLSPAKGPTVSYELPPGVGIAGVVGDRAVLEGGGRIFTLDPSGTRRPYAVGAVEEAVGQWVLWWGCDDTMRCRYHVGDLDNPDARPTVAIDDLARPDGGDGYGPARVSPDGRVALVEGISGDDVLVDLTDGRRLGFTDDSYGAWAWSPDSRWFFRFAELGLIEAVSTRDGHVVEVQPRSAYGSIVGSRVLGIG
jgi:hypothetical protein